ncbi:YfhO family protein [Fructobacillus sp. CRL 2054]|nr:YfhO family protein [Fructobacillus sp. CRL 2054]
MARMKKIIPNSIYSPVALSFWLPFFFLLIYFIYRHMAPFGSSTILTVDLGQQYLDYFAQFKHTVLHDPSAFFYSFSSGLGGDMVAEWSYYLMSPFNFIFLLANPTTLPDWILLVTLLKVAFAGLTMALFLNKAMHLKGYIITIFAINYPLSAWFIANDLNLLWLDTAILVPIVLLTLHKALRNGKVWPFTLSLALAILSNYYMAWMLALFLVLYLPIAWANEQPKHSLILLFKTTLASLSAVLVTAWLWLPTLAQLRLGKTTHSAKWTLGFENNPAFLFFKLIPGSFDFNQMQSGQANFLVAPIILFFIWPFFSKKSISWLEKLFSLLALSILILATCWTPLILLFHGGQYPVWYPARFSFFISLLIIILAARGYKTGWLPSIPARIFFLTGTLAVTIFGSLQLNKLSYLDKPELLAFLFVYLLTILTLLFLNQHLPRLWALGILTSFFLIANLAMTLNHISYLTNKEYQSGAKQVSLVDQSLKQDHSWYRVAEGLGRTYNDGFLGNFKAGSHFSSLLPANSATFYRNMGQISGDSKVSYNNGTTVLDSLLSFKYYLDQSNDSSAKSTTALRKSNRPDYQKAPVVASGNGWALKENQTVLPVAYAASNQALNTPINIRYPLANQERLLTYLAGKKDEILLTQQPLTISGSYNLAKSQNITGGVIQAVNKREPASLLLTFTPTTDGAYYLNLGGAFDLSGVILTLNGHQIKQESGYNHTVALNLANDAKGKEQTLAIVLQKGTSQRYLDDFALYAFDKKKVQSDLAKLRTHPLKITKSNSRTIEGSISTTKEQPLIMTSTLSAPGWSAKVDGKSVATKTVAGGLLAVPTTPGKHHVILTYTPPYLLAGIAISSTFAFLVLLIYGYKRFFSLARSRRP